MENETKQAYHRPTEVTGFHSCDRAVGLKVVLGDTELRPSSNPWDWLGSGVYFWEDNPVRALEYAVESSEGRQFNKIPIRSPLIIGAIIELGNCLNLVEQKSLAILANAYTALRETVANAGNRMPINKGNNRMLDCTVITYVHTARREEGKRPYDTVRSSFAEGEEVYPGASFSSRSHIQVCVINTNMIKAYFLPRPNAVYNPYLAQASEN